LTGKTADENFMKAASNLQLIKTKDAQKFHVPDLLTNDYVFITKQGLIELEAILEARHSNYFRNKKRASDTSIAKWTDRKLDPFEKSIIKPIVSSESIEGFDDSKPIDITTAALRRYISDLAKMQQQSQQA
jgi:hypothetical protein